jgi:hypothetical protein
MLIKEHFEKLSDPRLWQMYKLADDVATETADTLSDEFQIAAMVTLAVYKYFRDRESTTGTFGR